MKEKVKKIIIGVVGVIFLALCGVAVFSGLPEYKLKYGETFAVVICVGGTLLFALVNGLLIGMNFLVFTLLGGKSKSGKLKKSICLVLTILICPLVILLLKPVTVKFGESFLLEFIYDKWYKSGLAILNMRELHSYPALKIVFGNFNWGWIFGIVLMLILLILVIYLSGAKEELDKSHQYELDHVEHKEHLEITETVTYSGILNPKADYEYEAKIVDDTKYPVHGIVAICIFTFIGFILTPYITGLMLIARQIISLAKK